MLVFISSGKLNGEPAAFAHFDSTRDAVPPWAKKGVFLNA